MPASGVSRALSQHVERVVLSLCEDADTPRALTVAILVRNREYGQLFALNTDPRQYQCSESYFKDNLVTELLRKFQLNVPGIDRAGVALNSFWECELHCAKTNLYFRRLRGERGLLRECDVRLDPFLGQVRKTLSEILGRLPRDLELRFGPGATFEDTGHLTLIPDKMTSRPTITAQARHLLPLWERTAWARARACDYSKPYDPKTVRGNRFTTVPKDGLKDRGICIEPSLNVSLQLAVGQHIRRRLKLFGIDLDYGQDLHRDLAREGSLTGEVATIDLSNASDTVCYELLKTILPEDWFSLLETLRSAFTLVKGKWVRLEKFSSMGNGFTFELETLVFGVLCDSISRLSDNPARLGRGIWVYGDDIVVPVSLYDSVATCLSWAGFLPNPRKTFHEGPFRESCGGDFFSGKPVRAFYLKEDPDEPHKIIAMANGLRRVAHEDLGFHGRFDVIRRAWLRCLDMLPSHIRRLRGPVSAGDLVINDTRNWVVREQPPGSGIRFVRCWRPVQLALGWAHWKPMVVLASALYGQRTEGPSSRGSVSGYREGWVVIMESPPSASS